MRTPIIPWVEGKQRRAKRLLSCFPEHKCYVEPFRGGMALFYSMEPSAAERRITRTIEMIENGLAKVNSLTGYPYTVAGNRQMEVMADERQKIMPEAVGDLGDYHERDITVFKNGKSSAYGTLYVLLIEVIKHLSVQVKAQQADIDALKM